MSEITGSPDLATGTSTSNGNHAGDNGASGSSDWPHDHDTPTSDLEYREPKGSVVQLVAVVAAILAVAMLTHSLDLLIVIVAIIAMVMIHELGHFATAKWSDMKVTEYFLGFGPRLWSFRRGETEYGVKAIPLGGYVKIIGMSNTEEVDPADESRTYREQPFRNRLMVALAGSFMHFVMAFILLWCIVVFIGQPQGNTTVAGFTSVTHGTNPAEKGGLQLGDDITSINGTAVSSTQQLQKIIKTHAGVPLTVVVERGHPAIPVTLTVTPTSLGTTSGKNDAKIGIEIGSSNVPVAPFHALGTAGALVGEVTTSTLSALGTTFSPHGLNAFFSQLGNTKAADAAAKARTRPVSIVGAVRLADQGAQGGVGDLLWILVTIIVAVGIINLVPMLPLDGGHVLVAVYERFRSRKGRPYHADVTKLIPVASAFVLFLVIFVAAAVFLDIAHPIANPFQ